MKFYRAIRSGIVVSRVFTVSLLLATFLLLAVLLISLYSDIPVSKFTRDPMAIAGGRPFYGLLSNIGVVMWSSSMALCFFSYSLLKAGNASRKVLYFVVSGGALSLILLLDDLFMLHEHFYPRYLGYGEKAVFLTYGFLLLIYVVVFFDRIFERSGFYLCCFVFFFALSVLVDRLPETFLPMHHIFEDGSKLLGITSWLGFHSSACYHEIQSHFGLTSPAKSTDRLELH